MILSLRLAEKLELFFASCSGDGDGSACKVSLGKGVFVGSTGSADSVGVGDSAGAADSVGVGNSVGTTDSVGKGDSIASVDSVGVGDSVGSIDRGDSVGAGDSVGVGDSVGATDSVGNGVSTVAGDSAGTTVSSGTGVSRFGNGVDRDPISVVSAGIDGSGDGDGELFSAVSLIFAGVSVGAGPWLSLTEASSSESVAGT